jgi:hypothetical protein
MLAETAEEKFDRLRGQIQNLVLKAYPNPERIGCPLGRAVENLAKRASGFHDIQTEPDYQHVMHCSPCYREFLDSTEDLRRPRTLEDPEPMSRREQKRLSRTLDQLEAVMKSVAQPVRRR